MRLQFRKVVREYCPSIVWRPGSKIFNIAKSSTFLGHFLPSGGGGRPGVGGYYDVRKLKRIKATLSNPELLVRFAKMEKLPEGYGIGIDERCIEYPWLISRLGLAEGRLLDAGSTLNHAFLLDLPEI